MPIMNINTLPYMSAYEALGYILFIPLIVYSIIQAGKLIVIWHSLYGDAAKVETKINPYIFGTCLTIVILLMMNNLRNNELIERRLPLIKEYIKAEYPNIKENVLESISKKCLKTCIYQMPKEQILKNVTDCLIEYYYNHISLNSIKFDGRAEWIRSLQQKITTEEPKTLPKPSEYLKELASAPEEPVTRFDKYIEEEPKKGTGFFDNILEAKEGKFADLLKDDFKYQLNKLKLPQSKLNELKSRVDKLKTSTLTDQEVEALTEIPAKATRFAYKFNKLIEHIGLLHSKAIIKHKYSKLIKESEEMKTQIREFDKNIMQYNLQKSTKSEEKLND